MTIRADWGKAADRLYRCKGCGRFNRLGNFRHTYWIHVWDTLAFGRKCDPYWAAGCGCPKFSEARGCPDHAHETWCPGCLPELSRPALQRSLSL